MTNKKIVSILNRNGYFNIFSISQLESQNNKVFFINKKYIAKTTTRNEEHFNFLTNKLKKSGIKVPKVLKIIKINSKLNLIIYKFLEGNSFYDIKKIKPKTWKEIGVYLKKIHSLKEVATNKKNLPHFSRKNWDLFFDNFLKYRNKHKKLVPNTISKNNLIKVYHYLSELRQLKSRKLALLHGDYVLKNVLLNKEKKINGIIDFDNSQIGDPLIELGFIYLWNGLMTDWNNIANGYFLKSDLTKNKLINIKKYSVICALILLSKKDLDRNQYKWIKKRFKNLISELSL